jgi:hypothetical protein
MLAKRLLAAAAGEAEVAGGVAEQNRNHRQPRCNLLSYAKPSLPLPSLPLLPDR